MNNTQSLTTNQLYYSYYSKQVRVAITPWVSPLPPGDGRLTMIKKCILSASKCLKSIVYASRKKFFIFLAAAATKSILFKGQSNSTVRRILSTPSYIKMSKNRKLDLASDSFNVIRCHCLYIVNDVSRPHFRA